MVLLHSVPPAPHFTNSTAVPNGKLTKCCMNFSVVIWGTKHGTGMQGETIEK
jgi:hypothetical protein